MKMSPERVKQINKMKISEFRMLPMKEQRAYARIPLPASEQRAIMQRLAFRVVI